MPAPMTPAKPMTPAAAMAAKARDNLQKSGGPNVPQGALSTLDKLKAIGQGQDPNATADGTKQPGEKAFSIKTAQDPDGTVHVYAKNEQEAKQKYQQLGNPLGNANSAEEVQEDRDPNDKPYGPEFKPTMPKGTVRVDVSDVYDWYKLGKNIPNLKGLSNKDFGKGPPSTIVSFGDEDTEHEFINDLEATGLDVTDIDPADPKRRPGKKIKTDPTFNVEAADGWFAKQLDKAQQHSAANLGHSYKSDVRGFDADEEEKNPWANYRQSWTRKNKKRNRTAEPAKVSIDRPEFQKTALAKPYHIITINDRKGETVIMAKSPAEAREKWERKFGATGDKILRVSKPKEMEESMTTLKTTFEGIEDSIASLLENFGLENGRDFYIDGTIRTLDEQSAQDILSVLADHELPGQARMRQIDEGWAISLIGQGEELVENLTVGEDSIEIRHIGEGVVRVYVNSELAEQFDTGTAAFKYVKALQENLAEADDELMSALSAEAGEDLMKIDNITEGYSEWEDKKDSYRKAGATVDGKEDDYTVTSKDGSRKRYQNTKTGRKVTSLPPVEGKGEVDDEGNKVKRGRGRPKKVRESLAAIQAMRKQVSEALAKIDSLPEAQRNTPQVQAMVDRLTESVRNAIAKTK